jgi:VWFA-related protein
MGTFLDQYRRKLCNRKHLLHSAIIAAIAICAFAKDKENPEIKFTARTELVLIPAIVTDKSGNHITGLKKDDFTVLENGSERPIATFEEIASDPQRLLHAGKPNEFSNAVGTGGSTRRVTLIVLDFINTPFMDQSFARKELLKYLLQSMDRREPTGLYTLTRSGIHVIHDFTVDPGVLIAALRKVTGDASHLVDTPEDLEATTGTASPEGSVGSDPGTNFVPGGKPGASSVSASSVQQAVARLQTMIEDQALNFQSFEQRLAID